MNPSQEKPDEMEQPDPGQPALAGRQGAGSNLPVITLAAVLLVLSGLAFLAFSLSASSRSLYPALPSMTAVNGTPSEEGVEIDFTSLNADPAALLGERLIVTGKFMSLGPPECLNYSGPVIEWGLVSEDLQLSAVGFEDVVRLIADGTELKVRGIWRAYSGPSGCGKEPPDTTIWYLAVEKILEPNPLIGANGVVLTVIPGTLQAPDQLRQSESSPTPSVTSQSTDFLQPTGEATIPAGVAATATPTQETTPLPPAGTTAPGANLTGTPVFGSTPATITSVPPGGTPPVSTTPGLPAPTPGSTGYPSQGTPQPSPTSGSYP